MSTTFDRRIRDELEASLSDKFIERLDRDLVDEAVRNAARDLERKEQSRRQKRTTRIIAAVLFLFAFGFIVLAGVVLGGPAASAAIGALTFGAVAQMVWDWPQL